MARQGLSAEARSTIKLWRGERSVSPAIVVENL